MGELAGLCSLHWVKMGKFGRPASISHGDNQWFQNKKTHLDSLSLSSLFLLFLHGSFGLNSKWGYINPTYCTMVVVGCRHRYHLDSLPQNLDGLHIPKDTTKIKKTYLPSAIVRCLSCGSLPAVAFWVESEHFRTQVSKYHGKKWGEMWCLQRVTTGLGLVLSGAFGGSVCHSQETNSAAAAILEPEMSDPGAKSVSKRAAWC